MTGQKNFIKSEIAFRRFGDTFAEIINMSRTKWTILVRLRNLQRINFYGIGDFDFDFHLPFTI